MRNFNNKDNDRDQKPNDNMMKRPLTLDLNKKIVINNSGGPPILSTPDVNLCKLGSPELENYILNTDTLQTPSLQTPSGTGIFPQTAKVRTLISSEGHDFSSFNSFIDHNRARGLRQGLRGRIEESTQQRIALQTASLIKHAIKYHERRWNYLQ